MPGSGPIPGFALHTAIVYTCALRISRLLVSQWFAWVAPVLHISLCGQPMDWYRQDFERVIAVPALATG